MTFARADALAHPRDAGATLILSLTISHFKKTTYVLERPGSAIPDEERASISKGGSGTIVAGRGEAFAPGATPRPRGTCKQGEAGVGACTLARHSYDDIPPGPIVCPAVSCVHQETALSSLRPFLTDITV